MKVALAVWNGRISPVFDVSRDLLIIDIDEGRVVNRINVHFSSDHPMHKIRRLLEMKVAVLLCGAISRQLAAALEANGIDRLDFISGEIESVISAYLRGQLPNPGMRMPGCGPGRRRRRAKFGRKERKI
ncbi:MAG: NifB/NifX family molybdenum-iron cluster-binding protein [Desulfobacterales bacterium]|nr:NifB/NifX family molybdenum-iron cluster-binding protein [Desulfobacterales bacterium]